MGGGLARKKLNAFLRLLVERTLFLLLR